VAVAVVDGLEAVEVDHQQRALQAVAAHAREVVLERALEGAPVEQARQRVVIGQVAQLGLLAPALGDARRVEVGLAVVGRGERLVAAAQHVLGIAPEQLAHCRVTRANSPSVL
jgi:hypothetical protein